MTSLETGLYGSSIDDVNNYFSPSLTASIDNELASGPLKPVQPGPYKEFGDWLKEIREGVPLSQPAAVRLAAARKRPKGQTSLIQQGKLSHLERGWNRNPEPELLKEISELYGYDYRLVVTEWVRVRYGVAIDQSVADVLQQLRATGRQDAATSARLVEIGTHLVELGDEIAQLGDRRKSGASSESRSPHADGRARAPRKKRPPQSRDD